MTLDAFTLSVLAQAEAGVDTTTIVVIVVAAIVLGLIIFFMMRGGAAPETPKAKPPLEGEDTEKPSTNLLEDRMEVDAPVEIHEGMSLAEIKRAKAARVKRKDGSKRETAVEATEKSKADHGVEEEPADEEAATEKVEEPAEAEEEAVEAEAVAEAEAEEPAEAEEEAAEPEAAAEEPEAAVKGADEGSGLKKLPKPKLPSIGGLPAPSEASEVSEAGEESEGLSGLKKLPKPRLGKLPRPKTDTTDETEKAEEAEEVAAAEESEPAEVAEPSEPSEEEAEVAEAAAEPDVEVEAEADSEVEAEAAAETAAAPEVEPEPATGDTTREKPESESSSLEEGLAKTRTGFISRLSGLFQKDTLDDNIVEEVEEVLFTADIGPSAAQKIMNALEEELEKDDKTNPRAVWRFVRGYVEEVLARREAALDIDAHTPFVMLVIGVNGVGKTTTIGKMASKFRRQGKSVLMVAGDTFRAAAVEQLEVWGERTGIEVYKGEDEQDPASVVYEGVAKAVKENIDVVICDTAGRLQTNTNLLDELAKMSRVAGKVVEGSPHETILVLDANTGQNAIQQAKLFNEAVDISGIVLTKLDGTAKGGVILGICDEIDAPIRYIGIGEGVADLRAFDAGEFVEALFM